MNRPTAVGNNYKNINNRNKRKGTPIDFHTIEVPNDELIIDDEAFTTIDEDNQLMECLLNLPPLQEMHNPISMQNIRNHQLQDMELIQQHNNNPILYPVQILNGINVTTMRSDPQ
jgi:hypothetical protein